MTFYPPPLPTEPPRARSFVARHWRGEYPLWVSYWVIGFLLQLALVAVLRAIGSIAGIDGGYNPNAVFGVIVGSWLVIAIVFVWQFVGVWRSAGRSAARRRAEGRNAGWAHAARVMMVLAVGAFVVRLGNEGAPQMVEAWAIAFRGDPAIPDYAIRTMRGGTELEISGGFKYGLDRDLRAALAAAPGVTVVHLDSPGGRIGEARKVYETIRAHRLITYVAHVCASACTTAFLAGTERLVGAGAVLGFHSASFPGTAPAVDAQGAFFRQNGIAAGFVRRVEATPNSAMWTPTLAELEGAGVVTGVAPAQRFAVSGLGVDPSAAAIRAQLVAEVPLLDALAVADPAALDRIVALFREGYVAGLTLGDMVPELQQTMHAAILPHLPLAADETVAGIGAMIRDQYRALADRDMQMCRLYAMGQGAPADPERAFGAALVSRELALYTDALRTSDPAHALRPDARAAASATSEILFAVALDEALAAGDSDDVVFCRASIAFFDRVLALGDDGVPVLRLITERLAADADPVDGL